MPAGFKYMQKIPTPGRARAFRYVYQRGLGEFRTGFAPSIPTRRGVAALRLEPGRVTVFRSRGVRVFAPTSASVGRVARVINAANRPVVRGGRPIGLTAIRASTSPPTYARLRAALSTPKPLRAKNYTRPELLRQLQLSIEAVRRAPPGRFTSVSLGRS